MRGNRVSPLVCGLLSILGGSGAAGTSAAQELPVPEGFEPAGSTRSYDRKTVFEAINGAAELYVAYDFRSMRARSYRLTGSAASELEVGVQVFDQQRPLSAFGVFQRERPEGSVDLPSVGARAVVLAPYQCAALKGQYYVKAQAVAGELTAARCAELLLPILGAIPGTLDLPPELGLLPPGGRLPGTEGFTRESYLGTRHLTDCLHASYGPAAKPHQLFVMLPPPGTTLDALWSRLATTWKPGDGGAFPLLLRTIPYRGTVVIVRRDGILLGAADTGDLAAALAAIEAATGAAPGTTP